MVRKVPSSRDMRGRSKPVRYMWEGHSEQREQRMQGSWWEYLLDSKGAHEATEQWAWSRFIPRVVGDPLEGPELRRDAI